MGLIESWVVDDMMLNEPDGKVRSEMLDANRADQILNYLDKFEYATLRHALFALFWDTGTRIGSARSIDVEDDHPEKQYIELVHRPEKDSLLKTSTKVNEKSKWNETLL